MNLVNKTYSELLFCTADKFYNSRLHCCLNNIHNLLSENSQVGRHIHSLEIKTNNELLRKSVGVGGGNNKLNSEWRPMFYMTKKYECLGSILLVTRHIQ